MAKMGTTRFFSSKQEQSIKKSLKDNNARCTISSGSTSFDKGDVLTDKFIIEAKTKMTSSNSISIKKEWFSTLKQEMIGMNKYYSAIAFNFGPKEPIHYIIDSVLFKVLIDKLEEDEVE